MPQVPTYDARQVRDAPAPDQYQRANASAEDFGAATGRALQGMGNDVQRAGNALTAIAERQQDEDDAAAILQAQTAYGVGVNARLYQDQTNPDGTVTKGLFTTQGSDAMGVAGQFAKVEGDVYAEVSKALTTPRAREKFAQVRQRQIAGYQTAAMKHEADQRLKFQAETTDAATKTATLNAVSAYDKPEVVGTEIENIKRAIAANNIGSPAELVALKTRVAVSGVHTAITARMIEENPRAAKSYYDANKDAIEGADHLQLARAFEVPMRRQRAQEYLAGVDVAGSPGAKLVRAVVTSESSSNPAAVSNKGASGLMQVMPGTAREIDNALGGVYGLAGKSDDEIKAFYADNPAANLEHGSWYLQQQLTKYGGDIEAALVAYNAGPGNADKWLNAGRDYSALPKRDETEPYVRKTMTRYADSLGGGPNVSDARPSPRMAVELGPLPPPGERLTPENSASSGLSFYKPSDFMAPTGGGAWVDARSAKMADELGRRFFAATGVRVGINDDHDFSTTKGTSGKRRGTSDPADNPHVENSQHVHGRAFDFQVQNLKPEQKAQFLSLARELGFSGVGFYGDNGHLHLDTGKARSWGGLPSWARGVTSETASTGYLGQSSMAVGYGSLPMPANMARQASGQTAPYAAAVAAAQLPVTADFGGGGPSIMAEPADVPVAASIPPPVAATVKVDDYDPDAMIAHAEAAPEDIRDQVLRDTKRIISRKEAQRKSALKEVANEGWAHVLKGGSSDDLPPNIYSALMEQNPAAVKAMQEFEDRRERRDDKTDEPTYYKLSQMTPQQLAADDFDLMGYANKLSGEHLRHFAQKQADARKDVRDVSAGAGIISTKELGNMALGKMGIATSGPKATPESEARAGLFYMRLEQEVSAVQAAQKRKATPEEIQKITDALSTPVTSGGVFSSAKYRFEMGTEAENEQRGRNLVEPVGGETGVFSAAAELKDVPAASIETISKSFARLAKNPAALPKPDEVVSIFNQALTASTGRPVPVPSEKMAGFKTAVSKALGRVPDDKELPMLYSRWLRREYPIRIGE